MPANTMKKIWVLSTLMCLVLGVFLCFYPATSSEEGPKTLVDELDRTVTLPDEINRIVSLAPNITEILFALGVGDKIVGVTDYSDYPEKAKELPKVGSFSNPNIELVQNLKPDLVIATKDGNPEAAVKKLEDLGITTFVINPRNFQGIIKSIQNISKVLAREAVGTHITQAMSATQTYIEKQVSNFKKPKVLFQLGAKPIISINKNTFIHDVIEKAGGINIASESLINYPEMNKESIVASNPDIIIAATDESTFATIKQNWASFSNISAVKKKRIYRINPDTISRPAPRIMEGLVELYKLFHFPETLQKKS